MSDYNDDGWKELSPTALITFMRCPKKYYFQKVAKIEVPRDETALIFGKIIHAVFEDFYIEIDPEDIEDADVETIETYFMTICEDILNQHWNYGIGTETKNNNDLKEEALAIFESFAWMESVNYKARYDADKIDTFFPANVEEDITSEKRNIRCIVDRRNQTGNIIDYKSNKIFPEILLSDYNNLSNSDKKKYKDKMFEYKVQAMMNAMCIEDKYEERPKNMIFMFVRHLPNKQKKSKNQKKNKNNNGVLKIPITDKYLNEVENYIDKASKMINAGKYPRTANKSNCLMYNGCEYKQMCDAQNICIMAL